MFRCLLWAIAAAMRPRVLLIADNLCLRQQLLVLQRRKPRPRFTDADRRFWILAYRWFVGWGTSLLIVKPETVLRAGTVRGGGRMGVGVQAGEGRRAAARLRSNCAP
jgi:hypothetical protein